VRYKLGFYRQAAAAVRVRVIGLLVAVTEVRRRRSPRPSCSSSTGRNDVVRPDQSQVKVASTMDRSRALNRFDALTADQLGPADINKATFIFCGFRDKLSTSPFAVHQ